MTTKLQRKHQRIKDCLDNHRFKDLFLEELGWDDYTTPLSVILGDTEYQLEPVAHKRGCAALHCDTMPDSATRAKIETRVAKSIREHLIIFTDSENGQKQRWQWVRRIAGQPLARKEHEYHPQQPLALIERLYGLEIAPDEEEDTDLVDVLERVRSAMDVERMTKRFYDQFKNEQKAFQDFIDGITDDEHQRWYSSVMLDRLMFVYFIQKKGFLDNDVDYLRHRLDMVRAKRGEGQFQTFYKHFLMKLCHEVLDKPVGDRKLDPELLKLVGRVPYLNGGIFQEHELERDYPDIDIPDEAFEKIFDFFDRYTWHLDTRPNAQENEINPDVLGYIFEKYINQKQMGAYYTKEDITEYISKNTIIPCLFDKIEKDCKIAFEGETSIWRHLQEDPDRYIYPAMRHGISYDVHADDGKGRETDNAIEYPENIAIGLDTAKPNLLERRQDWNTRTPPEAGLPTEIWRETIARHQRYHEVRHALENLIPASESEAGVPPPDPRRGISTPRTPQTGDGTDPTADASVGSGSVTVGHSTSGDDERSANCANLSDLRSSQNHIEGVQGESLTPPARGCGGEKPPQFSINDLITYNCDIRQFAQDVIERCESPDLLNAIWVAIAGRIPQNSNEHIKSGITVLDPTCGSGAFLFAALNILEPLYEACLDRMQEFLDEWNQSSAGILPAESGADVSPANSAKNKQQRHPHGNYAKFFQSILDDINHNHPSRKYYIYKSIIVNNLYGVDIMHEAVEICKLRLFLKLVAQVEKSDRIEPLPDIDFNIRAGNTLVGFAAREQMEDAMRGDLLAYSTVLPEILEQADECDTLFQLFRRAQLENDSSAPQAKQELAEKLAEINTQLNHYLAEQYGVDTKKQKKYDEFLDSHQPFHWFTEFYGIMNNGGFDCVIGNPPYVEYSKVRNEYKIKDYTTEDCGNLYAFCIERFLNLAKKSSAQGLIIPLSIVCSERMTSLRHIVADFYKGVWFNNYDTIPSTLFSGIVQRNTILILNNYSVSFGLTRLQKWYTAGRDYIFENIHFIKANRTTSNKPLPKIGTLLEEKILRKIAVKKSSIYTWCLKSSAHVLEYKRRWSYFLLFAEQLEGITMPDGTIRTQQDNKKLFACNEANKKILVSALSSNVFYFVYTAFSDVRHLNIADIKNFHLGADLTTEQRELLQIYCNKLMVSYLENLELRHCNYKGSIGKCKVPFYRQGASFNIIRKIDCVLAEHYGFTDEELDFIINYDIKYRMGDALLEEEK